MGMRIIEFLQQFFIKIQYKVQHLSLILSLIIVEIMFLYADFALLITIPEIGPTILTILIVVYFLRKIRLNKKYKSFIGIINSLIFWNYTFKWVHPNVSKEISS